MWANRSGCSPKKSNHERCAKFTQRKWASVSKLLQSLIKKEQISKEWRERFAHGHKRKKKCQKYTKNTNFLSNSLIFAIDLLESQANLSHRSFLRAICSWSLFCKEQRERIAHGRSLKWAKDQRAKERMSKRVHYKPCRFQTQMLFFFDIFW